MFGIGGQELILILVVALLVFGPKRLPDLARSLGKGMAEFRRASNDLRQNLQEAEQLAKSEDATPDSPGPPAEARKTEATPPSSGDSPGEPAAKAEPKSADSSPDGSDSRGG